MLIVILASFYKNEVENLKFRISTMWPPLEEDCSGDVQNGNFPPTSWTHVKILAAFYVNFFACREGTFIVPEHGE